jgi:rubrerythrin/uncharacterized membrane protein YphA (DoxX/SURF4 family)
MDAPAHRAVVRADDLLRLSLGAVWILEGLLPKLLFLRQDEIDAFVSAAPFLPTAWSDDAQLLVRLLGALEVLLGVLLVTGRWVRPVLWTMLGLLALFTLDLLILRPALLLDPAGGLIKNVALLGATAALLTLRGERFAPVIALVARLRRDYLNEIGAEAVYRQQARAARRIGLGEALETFAATEREHGAAVADALSRLGARAPRREAPVAAAAGILGWFLGRLGDRAMLTFDLGLEKAAVRSYAASAAQFAAWGEELLAAEFRLMAAAEEDHARRLRDLLADLRVPA